MVSDSGKTFSKPQLCSTWLGLQVDLTSEGKSAQEKAMELAKQFAKSAAGWQQAQAASNAYLPNGDPNPMLKAALEAAQKLGMQVSNNLWLLTSIDAAEWLAGNVGHFHVWKPSTPLLIRCQNLTARRSSMIMYDFHGLFTHEELTGKQ